MVSPEDLLPMLRTATSFLKPWGVVTVEAISKSSRLIRMRDLMACFTQWLDCIREGMQIRGFWVKYDLVPRLEGGCSYVNVGPCCLSVTQPLSPLHFMANDWAIKCTLSLSFSLAFTVVVDHYFQYVTWRWSALRMSKFCMSESSTFVLHILSFSCKANILTGLVETTMFENFPHWQACPTGSFAGISVKAFRQVECNSKSPFQDRKSVQSSTVIILPSPLPGRGRSPASQYVL